MPAVIASHVTPLSQTGLAHALFGARAGVGAQEWVDLAIDTAGYHHPAYTVPGIAHAQLALDVSGAPGTYGAVGASLSIGELTTLATRIWVKVASAANPAPQLVLPPDGIEAVSGTPVAAGHGGVTDGAYGTVGDVEAAGGSGGDAVGATGTADPAVPAGQVSGHGGDDTGGLGAAMDVEAAAGSGGDAVGGTGTASPVAAPAGVIWEDPFDAKVAGNFAGAYTVAGGTATIPGGPEEAVIVSKGIAIPSTGVQVDVLGMTLGNLGAWVYSRAWLQTSAGVSRVMLFRVSSGGDGTLRGEFADSVTAVSSFGAALTISTKFDIRYVLDMAGGRAKLFYKLSSSGTWMEVGNLALAAAYPHAPTTSLTSIAAGDKVALTVSNASVYTTYFDEDAQQDVSVFDHSVATTVDYVSVGGV